MKARGRMVSIPEPVAAYLLNALRVELDANQDPPSDEYNLMGVAANALANGLQKLKADEEAEGAHADQLQSLRCAFRSEFSGQQCVHDTDHPGEHEDFLGSRVGPWGLIK